MAGNFPFLFIQKKILCQFIAIVEVVGFILIAVFSSKIIEREIEESDAIDTEVDSLRAKYMTAILIYSIAGAVFHLIAVAGIFFEHLYITAGVALIEVLTVVGALLEAIMIHNIFWFAFGVSLVSLACLALHIFDLMSMYNFEPDYTKTHRPNPPTVDPEDSE